MRNEFFTYAERVSVYVEGKRAREEGRLRSYNPYTESKDLGSLWWHGWDTANNESNVYRKSPSDKD